MIGAFYAAVLVLYGIIFGAIMGLISHALSGGRRDFSSVGGMQAGRYDVTVDEEVAEEASRLIAGPRWVRKARDEGRIQGLEKESGNGREQKTP